MVELYIRQILDEIGRTVNQKSWKQCESLRYTYLGITPEGSEKGISRPVRLDGLLARKEKGEEIIDQAYKNTEIRPEAKTAMDVMQSTFIEYMGGMESRIDTWRVDSWRNKLPKEATRGLYELSMAYTGREFNGEKSPNLESIESRYKRASHIIQKLTRKDLTKEKIDSIKDLTKRFEEYEKGITPTEKYKQALREKNRETIYTLERFAQYHKIIKTPPRKIKTKSEELKKQPAQKPKEPTKNILFMPVGEAIQTILGAAKKILFKKIF